MDLDVEIRGVETQLESLLCIKEKEHFQAQIDYRGQIFTVAVGDTIPMVGKVDLIDSKQVVIKTDNGLKTYPTPGNEPISKIEKITRHKKLG